MKNITVKKILELINGELITGNEDFECENFSKDTRQIKEKDTYIGIKGENFDGNAFWKEALEKGAKCVIVENIDFTWNIISDFEIKQSIDNGSISLLVNDENYIGSSFLLQLMIDNEVVSQLKIQVTGLY